MARAINAQGAAPTSGTKVLYKIHPGVQQEFMESEAEEVMYGGAAGGGKSLALRAMAVDYCLRYPMATVVLFRRTFAELEDTHIKKLHEELPSYVATYKSSSHDFIFTNGSVLMLRFCEKEDDVYKYDTFEADMELFDELTAFSQFQYVYLMSRCRSTKKWWPGRRIRSATNPGNVGHLWVKKRFVDFAKPFEIRRGPNNEGGMTRQFIPAKITDNPTLMRFDPNYILMLRALPDEEYRAKALGDWDVFSGQFFTRYKSQVHECEDFEIPRDWPRIITADWGLAAPHSVHWLARCPGTGFVWIYREQYGAGVPTREQARLAAQRTRASEEKIEIIVLDPAMFAREKDADGNLQVSIADIWREEFRGIADVVRGNNERIQGASLYREMLDWKGVDAADGEITVIVPPRLKVFKSCTEWIRTVPALVHSKVNVEDVDTNGEDHAYDDTRYGLKYWFTGATKPKAQRFVTDVNGNLIALPA